MNMSKNIQSPSALSGTPCDNKTDCEMEIRAQHETETDACLSKNSISVIAESGQPVSSTQHEDVSSEHSKRNITPPHCTAFTKETDGGWGWIIVFAVFCITSLIGGVVYSIALLYIEFVDMFDASRAVAGGIGSLHLFMSHILGNSYMLLTNVFLLFCIDMAIFYRALKSCYYKRVPGS